MSNDFEVGSTKSQIRLEPSNPRLEKYCASYQTRRHKIKKSMLSEGYLQQIILFSYGFQVPISEDCAQYNFPSLDQLHTPAQQHRNGTKARTAT